MIRIAVLLLFSAGLQAQTIWQLPLWNGQRYEWPTLGPSFTVKGGVVDVLPAPPAKVHTHSGLVKLTAASGTYSVPATAVNVAIHRNGILQFPGADYTLVAGIITPLYPDGWSTSLVVAEYEIQ